MTTVTIHKAKTQLSKLTEQAALMIVHTLGSWKT
jgi:hypothetical protein